MCFPRFDLELELTCYHDNERQDVCNWPAAVSVHVNNEPMPIDRVSGCMNAAGVSTSLRSVCVLCAVGHREKLPAPSAAHQESL